MTYLGNSPGSSPSIVVSEYIATAGQTTFSASYYEYVQVYLNGMLLSASDYVANDGSTVVLAVGANAGDVVLINGYEVWLQGPAGEDGDVLAANNLSELTDKAVARTNLNVYSKTEVQTALPKVGFDTSNVTVPSAGQMAWNQDEQTVDIGLTGGVVLQSGQEIVKLVRNGTASTIVNGTVVMATGSIGNSGRIVVAPSTGLFDGARYVYGVATQDILAGADGYVTTNGKVRGIDTTGTTVSEVWADGDVLYVKPNDEGRLTNVEPAATELKMPVAQVVHAHVAGTLEIRIGSVINENAFATSTHGHTALTGLTVAALKETSVAMPANDINLATGNLFTKTITGATTLTVSNVPASGTVGYFILSLTNGGAGTITWFSGVKWAGGTAPTLTASGNDILSFYTIDAGTTWKCISINKDVK